MDLPVNMNELVDGMQNIEQTSFDDLPDDILINIFTCVDLPTGLKLRLNKRLVKIYRSIKMKITQLQVEFIDDQFVLTMDTSDGRFCRNYGDFNLLENTLRGLVNTSVDNMKVITDDVPDEKVAGMINLLSNFDANRLEVWRRGNQLCVPQVTLSTLLTLAQNVIYIDLGVVDSVSTQDLCALRKIMLEDNCKLKYFRMTAKQSTSNNFVKECFGITIEYGFNEFGNRTRIFRAGDESVEMFSKNVFVNLTHFEDGLLTAIKPGFYDSITFKKGGAKPDEKDKVKINHLYIE